MSAGPLEAMVELQRFFGLKLSDTDFGQKLVAAALKENEIEKLKQNVLLERNGKRVSSFDLTEEKDGDEAISLLKG